MLCLVNDSDYDTTYYKNAMLKNLIILFVFFCIFCVFEPMDFIFLKSIVLICLNLFAFPVKIKNTYRPNSILL